MSILTSNEPITPIAPVSLFDEPGEFLLTFSGNHYALGFRGESDFIERCFNWAYNRGVIAPHARRHYLYEKQIGYVLVRNLDCIQRGLAAQFRSEIIHAREVPFLNETMSEDGEWAAEFDEPKIESLATQRAQRFMIERVEKDSFLMRIKELAPVYAVTDPEGGEEEV